MPRGRVVGLIGPDGAGKSTLAGLVTDEVVRDLSFPGEEPVIEGLKIPGAWVTASSELRTPDGREVAQEKSGG